MKHHWFLPCMIKVCGFYKTHIITVTCRSSEGVPMVVLVLFSYQGDNVKEALQLATSLDSWLHLRDSSVSVHTLYSLFQHRSIISVSSYFPIYPLLWLCGMWPYFYGFRLIIIESLIFVAHHIYFYIILYMKLQNTTHLFLCSQSWKTRKVNDNQPCNDYALSVLHTLQPGIPHLPGTWCMVDLLHTRCSSYRTILCCNVHTRLF